MAQEKIDRLVKDAKLAQESFNQCVEYFGKKDIFVKIIALFFLIKGETPRTQNPSNFFSVFVKFQRAYQVRLFSIKIMLIIRFSLFL